MRELGPRRFVAPVVDVDRALAGARGYVRYLRDRRRYRRLAGEEAVRWGEAYPQLHDWTQSSPFDKHYFYQDTWAAQRIAERVPERHVDVGSRIDLVGFLTAICPVAFVDIRPLEVDLERFESIVGDLLDLPFEDRSLDSVSCLHVAEHVGLGRYGDSLDSEGTRRAARSLQRVLAPGGQLLFSLPVGRPRTCFNAHRIHRAGEVRELFDELELLEFAGVDDAGRFRTRRELRELDDSIYACGMFRLTRAT